jgi:hypothetical protein
MRFVVGISMITCGLGSTLAGCEDRQAAPQKSSASTTAPSAPAASATADASNGSAKRHIHVTDAARAAPAGKRLDINVMWAENIDSTQGLLKYANPLIEASPWWGRYEGFGVMSMNGSNHTAGLVVSSTSWPTCLPDLESYCASVGIPSAAIIIVMADSEAVIETFSDAKVTYPANTP